EADREARKRGVGGVANHEYDGIGKRLSHDGCLPAAAKQGEGGDDDPVGEIEDGRRQIRARELDLYRPGGRAERYFDRDVAAGIRCRLRLGTRGRSLRHGPAQSAEIRGELVATVNDASEQCEGIAGSAA